MKKLPFAFTAMLFIVTATAFAQDTLMPKRHIAFGIKGGVDFSSVIARKDVTSKSKGGDIIIGGFGGFYMTIPSGKGFSIQPEVVYNGFGWKYIQFNGPTIKYTFNYISVPLLARYTVENAGLSMYLGPQANFLISAKASADTAFKKDNYKTVDVAGVAGVEYLFTKGWNFSVRYQYGLMNIVKNPLPDSYLKLHAITVAVGYLFHK